MKKWYLHFSVRPISGDTEASRENLIRILFLIFLLGGPSYRDLLRYLSIRSTATLRAYILRLSMDGLIEDPKKRARSFRITEKGVRMLVEKGLVKVCPCCSRPYSEEVLP
jgi:hypothetical protein